MSGIFFLSPGPVITNPNQQSVHSNSTITSSGNIILSGYGATEVTLFINVLNSPTGSSPTLQYTLQEVDPGDNTTSIGTPVTSTSINAIGIQKISIIAAFSGTIQVSWTIGGTGSPTFTGVYATLLGKSSSTTLVDVNGNVIGASNPLKVDASGTIQPVSGSVTANIGTTGGLALDATLTGGTAKSIIRGGAKGATTIADVTSTAEGTDHQAVDIQIYHGGSAINPTQIRALTSSDIITSVQGTGAAASAPWSIELSDGAAFYTAAKTGQFPSALVGGRLDANIGAWLGSTAPTVGSKTSANSIPVVIASDQGTITISGTITANIGTTNGLALDTTVTKLTISQGTALGSNTQTMVGGSVTTAAPTYTTGQINPLSLTTAGALRIDGSGSTQPVSGTVSANQSGTWTVQPGNTPNTSPWLTTINQGGNSATVSAGGALKVDGSAVIQPISGTITANIGTSGSLALDATLAKLTVAQGAALGSNTQALIGGSVTTAAPTYTTGQVSPFSLTTAGAVRVDNSANAQPVQIVSTISVNNSTTSPLTATSVFTGTGELITSYESVSITIFADVASGVGGLQIQQSTNNINWDITDSFNVMPSITFSTTVKLVSQYFRVVFTNGVTNQTTFRLQSVFHPISETLPRALSSTQHLKTDTRARESYIHNNSTVTTGGSTIITSFLGHTAILVINISGSPTGSSPTLTYTIAEVDPIDQTTVVGDSFTTAAFNAATTTVLNIETHKSTTLKVSWVVGGTSSPTFTGVNTSIVEKIIQFPENNSSSLSNVSGSASSVNLLASNLRRRGATIYNDSSAILYVKFGATASTSSYTVKMVTGSYYELPFGYTGQLDGIWDSATGAARITEITA